MKTYRPHSHHLFLLIPCFGLLVLLGSCVKPSERPAVLHPALAEIDSLLWSRPDIAALMQRAYNTVIERKMKIKKIVGCDNLLSIALRNKVIND